eukprot:gene43461-21105_t
MADDDELRLALLPAADALHWVAMGVFGFLGAAHLLATVATDVTTPGGVAPLSPKDPALGRTRLRCVC